MRQILLAFLIFLSFSVFSQKVDTVITTSIYKSYYSKSERLPLFVAYKLYHGGGECDRQKQGFKFKKELVNSMDAKNYAHSGYDIGHLANAEDFANICEYEELTFRFYNALPQTANCNRGVWKSRETEDRKISQTDSMLLILGGYEFETKTFTYLEKKKECTGTINVPMHLYRIEKNLRSKNIHCYVFTNDTVSSTVIEVTYEKLMLMIPYSIEFMKYDLNLE